MAEPKNFADDLSFSFKFDNKKCGEENNKNKGSDGPLPKKLQLRLSPEDIFCNPPEEKGSFYSYEMGLDLSEIRFCEKSPEIAGKEEKKRALAIEVPPLEFSFTNEFNGEAQPNSDSNALEALFRDNEMPANSRADELPVSSRDAKPNTHYTLSEDYFLLFKIGEYRSRTPRRLSKEGFIQSMQPLLGRTVKSISKRIDRLRALSLLQKKRLLMYVRTFPLQSLSRKAVFDSRGKSLVIKPLASKSLPRSEHEYLQRTSPQFGGQDEPEPWRDASNDMRDEVQITNYFDDYQSQNPTFDLRPSDAQTSIVDHAEGSGAQSEDHFWQAYLEGVYSINFQALEDKIESFKTYNEESVYRVGDPEALNYLIEFMRWSFKVDAKLVLDGSPFERCKSFSDLRNLFLVALPHKNLGSCHFDFN